MVYPALLSTIKADAHTTAASSRLNWRPCPCKWTRPFRAIDEMWFLRVFHHISTGLYQVHWTALAYAVQWTLYDCKFYLTLWLEICGTLKLTILFISVFNQLDAQNLFHNKFYFMPLHVSSTCAHHQVIKIALHSLWYHHTYRCDDTRGCIPPDDEHMCSKHVETRNKIYCETILCIKLVNYWDKYAEMHCQRNVRIWLY